MATKKATVVKFPLKVELKKEAVSAEMAKGRLTEYEVKEIDSQCVHVELEKVNFDSASGKKKSKPRVQMFDGRAWNNFRGQAKKLGWNYVRVLYAPEGTNLEIIDPVKAETKTGKK